MRWWTFFVLVGVLGWSAPASADDEFAELNLVRSARLQLVEVALKQREIFETENGLLSLREPASELARKLTELENKDRLRQFQMIAKASGSDADQVGSEFALKNGYSPSITRWRDCCIFTLHPGGRRWPTDTWNS